MEEFEPLLTTRDWNEEWKELQKRRRHADDAAFWDKRARTFDDKDAPNPYVERFLELAGIRPGETVLDMGCGTGALAVPLGAAGHRVLAADFSRGMLDVARANLDRRGISCVETTLLSWDGDWQAAGAGPSSFDVALASRSIATADLRDSLLRLTDAARRRVCITLAGGPSPRLDERVLAAVGVRQTMSNDFLYAFNILVNEGMKPQVDYIRSERMHTFDSFADAEGQLLAMAEDAVRPRMDDAARVRVAARLHEWLQEDLVENEEAGLPDRKGIPQGAYRLSRPRVVTWAFLAWDK